MTVAARKPAEIECLTCDVTHRTGENVRLRARGAATLFDDPARDFGMAIGQVVLVDAEYEDGTSTISAEVIGLPRPAVIEIRTRGELEPGTKTVAIRKSRIG